MIGMDCINVEHRDCNTCIWHTSGSCASWDCEYISRDEALEAVREKRQNECQTQGVGIQTFAEGK